MRAGQVFRVLAAVVACALAIQHPSADAQSTPTKITKQEPAKGPVGSELHVEGTGCPPTPDQSAGTFDMDNGSGVEFEFRSRADGTFSFDYEVAPAEAGEQHPDSVYGTKLFCRSTNRTISGPMFEITGPVFTLRPESAPLGSAVRVVGTGCVQDGGGDDDGVLLVDGEAVRKFKADEKYGFDFTFDVPTKLAPDRRYVVQVNCLIQRLESAAGEGGQRAVVATLIQATPAVGGPTRAVATTAPARVAVADDGVHPLVAIGSAIPVLSLIVLTVRRIRRSREPVPQAVPAAPPSIENVAAISEVDNGPVPVPEPQPPFAAQRPFELTAFGDVRVDPFYWLRERDNPDTIGYLEAENAYADDVLAPLADLRRELFGTIKARTKEDDTSPPVPLRDWEYYVRTAEGAQYPDSCRRPRGGGEERVILDRNAMAEGHDYLSCLDPRVSPNDQLALYAADFDGSEKYSIHVRNLETLEDLPDVIPETAGDMCWVTDDVFLYVMLDDAHRPFQVRRHVVGDDYRDDAVVYEDDDERFFVHLTRDLAGRFVFVRSGSKISNEDHFLEVADPLGPLTVVEPRVDGVEYETADDGERFVILTNADGAADFKIVTAPVNNPRRTSWTDLVPHRPGIRVTEVAVFKAFIAIGERHDAVTSIRLLDRASGAQHTMRHNQEVYAAEIDDNAEFDTNNLRFTFTSLNTPTTWIDYDVVARNASIVKQTEVLGDFSASNYVTAREWATALDGTRIPISILHHRDFVKDGSAPALLYGYGSYEISVDPTFSIARLNLVDRGVVFAIAHVRGGGEMGRSWYENGKMLKKRNTFTDFIACAEHLIETGWCAPDRLAARGGSAGGLLMGAVANMAPRLFNTVVAEVPFVDVVTTMADETIPLTVTEWEEWGNPRDNADDYQYMKSYSPYDNVVEQDYPALFVEAGLNDPRVQYWEPAKWVAKLRVTKTDDRPLLLKTEMGAGHAGPSGRYNAWEDEARVQAFVLSQLGVDDPRPSPKRSAG